MILGHEQIDQWNKMGKFINRPSNHWKNQYMRKVTSQITKVKMHFLINAARTSGAVIWKKQILDLYLTTHKNKLE